jgi:LuxR family maltose regulon positive regulatory protein
MTRRLALLRAMIFVANDDLDAVRRSAEEWLQCEPGRTPLYAVTATLAATITHIPELNYTEARRYLSMAQAASAHVGGPHSHAWLATVKALLELDQGFPVLAEQTLEAGKTRAAEQMGPRAAMVATMTALTARALSDQGRCDEARVLLRQALSRSAEHGFAETTRHGLEAAVALGNGEESGPLGFAMLETIAAGGSPRLRRMLAATQIRRLLILGETQRALEIARQYGFDKETGQEQWKPSEALAVALARADLLITEGRARAAHKLTDSLLRQVTKLGRRREAVEIHLSIARLHMLTNDMAQAIRSISRALSLAASRQLVQPFLQHEQMLSTVLRSARLKELALTTTEQIRFCELICGKTGITIGQATGHATNAGEVDMLTRREREVLVLLEAGPSNEQLADQMMVSVQTIKWHLYNLYAKLGVKNRAAALSRARALKVLPAASASRDAA